MKPSHWGLTPAVLVGFAAAILLLFAAGIAAFVEYRHAAEAENSSLHDLEVLDQSQHVLTDLVDAETGLRGYLLTGAEHYLEPYGRATHALPEDLSHLRELTGDDATQQARVESLEPLISSRIAELQRTLGLRQSEGSEAALAVVRTDVGNTTMGRIRRLLAEFSAEESELLRQRLRRRATLSGRAQAFIIVAMLGSLLFGFGSVSAVETQTRRRLRAERAVRESEERLRTTLQSIGDAVIATDPSGHIVFLNPAAEALTGWTQPEARGLGLDEVFRVVNEQAPFAVESPVATVLRGETLVGVTDHTILQARDGREVPIDSSSAPIRDAQGDVTGVVLVFRDVTGRRAEEEERTSRIRAEAARAQAEAANAAKDEFLAVLSHELRSPLSAMMGWVTLLKRRAVPPARMPRAVEVLERNVQLQAQLVNDLLDVSRIISGKLALEEELVDLATVVHLAVEDARPAAQAKEVTLTLGIEPLSGAVVGDGKRLQQVATNLLTNAIKFTPSGGEVRVTLSAGHHEAILQVADTGVGIAPAFLPHVFDRFRQAEASSTRHHGGLGLGLAIVKNVVEMQGGSVTAASAGPDQGATFTVRLPLHAIPAVRDATSAVPSDDGVETLRGRTVLVVDDDHDTREALSMALESSGARVSSAGSASEALDALSQALPDIIVSDIGMAGEDGYAFIAKVRQRYGTGILAVALTGFASPQDRAKAEAMGFNEHVAKPVDPAVLIARLGRVLHRS